MMRLTTFSSFFMEYHKIKRLLARIPRNSLNAVFSILGSQIIIVSHIFEEKIDIWT